MRFLLAVAVAVLVCGCLSPVTSTEENAEVVDLDAGIENASANVRPAGPASTYAPPASLPSTTTAPQAVDVAAVTEATTTTLKASGGPEVIDVPTNIAGEATTTTTSTTSTSTSTTVRPTTTTAKPATTSTSTTTTTAPCSVSCYDIRYPSIHNCEVGCCISADTRCVYAPGNMNGMGPRCRCR